jgi:tetratricopeptide (TPR) repeat protein
MNSRRRRDDGFNQSSFLGWIKSPFRALRRLGSTDDRIQTDRSPLQRLLGIVFFPLILLGAFAAFMVQSWATHRSGAAFLKGIPAVLAVTGFLGGIWLAGFLRESRSVNATRNYLVFHIESQKLPAAEMFATKLVELKPEDDSVKYQLALLRENNGKDLEAEDLMSFIAPDDQPGYANAHVWRSGQEMKRLETSEGRAVDEGLIQRHLDLALEAEPANELALVGLADFYRFKASEAEEATETRQKFTNQAIEQLKKVVGNRDERTSFFKLAAMPQLLQLLVENGRAEEAYAGYIKISEELNPLAFRNPEVFEIWLALIRSAVAVKDYSAVQRILDDARQLTTSNEVRQRLALLASNVIMQQADEFADMTDRDDYRRRMNTICRSLNINIQNRRAYRELLRFAAAKSNPDFNEEWLRDSIVGSADQALVQSLIGMYLICKGDFREGKGFWRIANSKSTEPARMQYQLAMLMEVAIDEYSEDFPKMLDMLSLAIELFPDQPLFYKVRGIYMKNSDRYADASKDLEQAVESLSNDFVVRKHLVDCYQQLDKPDSARDHQLELDRILSTIESSRRKQIVKMLEEL